MEMNGNEITAGSGNVFDDLACRHLQLEGARRLYDRSPDHLCLLARTSDKGRSVNYYIVRKCFPLAIR